jgi:hypothetical protein
MFSSLHPAANPGSWIKDKNRNDRSLGYVLSIDKDTDMMLVRFPKISKDTWLMWGNHGHYVVVGT